MKYCPRCGVVLPEEERFCPLCGALSSSRKPDAAELGALAFPKTEARPFRPKRGAAALPADAADDAADAAPADESDPLTSNERRRLAVELISVAAGIALAVVLLADLFANGAITWSRWAGVGVAGAWLFLALPLILRRHPWVLYAALAPSVVLIVFLFDALDGRLTWFLSYGLPIGLSLDAVAAAMGGLFAAVKRKGLNAPAILLCGAAAFCCCVETTVDLNVLGRLSYDWSAVVAFALVPSAGLLFYLHYRVVNRASLRKLFRL